MDDPNSTQLCESPKLTAAGLDAPPERRRYLIVLHGTTPGSMVPLSSGTLWVGRGERNDLILPEPSVSRRHASLRLDRGGTAWITDLMSTNGSFRNGLRLPPHESIRLQDGDRVKVGSQIVLKYSCPDRDEEAFQKSMFERSVRDPLTGLYNRAYFSDQLTLMARRAPSRRLGLAVLMIDIDHFKRINDRLGHDAGDAVLREVASRIRRFTRSDDLVARYGGEEFAIAIPVSSAASAYQRAERIRKGFSAHPMRFEGEEIEVTASIGLAFDPHHGLRGIPALVSAADRSLYLAKTAGRDRVDPGSSREPATELTPATVDGL